MYFLASTPFDLIIGKSAIKQQNLVKHFSSYFGLNPNDFFPIHLSEVQDANQNNLTHSSEVQVNDPTHSSGVRVPTNNVSTHLPQ